MELIRAPLAPRWLLWTVAALMAWGVWALLVKVIGTALSASHSQALSTVGLIPVAGALVLSRRLSHHGNRRRGTVLALFAGMLGCVGNVAYYQALQTGDKAATVVALTSLYPLITVVLAVLLLRERLNRVQTIGILLSLVAIYLFNVSSEEGLISPRLIMALLPIACWGLAGLCQKLCTNHISSELSTLWFLSAFVPTAAVILWQEPLPEHIAAPTWGLVTALGFTFALGNYALLAALAAGGKASIVVPLSGLYAIVSIPIAMVFLGERVGARELAGILLALVAVVALSWESSATSPRNSGARP